MIEEIILTGNCYWCLEAVFKKLKGVVKVESGNYYIDDYEFAFGQKDKLEAVRITYDRDLLSLELLFNVYYIAHNPTLNVWKKDECFYPFCRPAVFYYNQDQKQAIENKVTELKKDNVFSSELNVPIQTKIAQVIPDSFFLAEEKNRDYFEKNPTDGYCLSIIVPKLEKLKEMYKSHLIA